jgi:hypothetical protein
VAKDNYGPAPGVPPDRPCCVRPIQTQYRIQYATRQVTVTHRVYFDAKYPVQAQDVWDTDNGKRLMVKGIFDTDELGDLFVCDCEEQL